MHWGGVSIPGSIVAALPTVVGRACPQAGGAGTKAERGHSCPQQCRTEVKLSDVPILLGIRELLRTRMSALRWRPKNLRALRRLSHIVIQCAANTDKCPNCVRFRSFRRRAGTAR